MQLHVKCILSYVLIVSKNTTVEIQLSNRKEKKKMGNKETTLKEIFEDIDTSKVELVRANNAKIMLIVWPKKTQMPQKYSVQFVCLSPKIWVF